MKNISLFLAVALTVSSCYKENPNDRVHLNSTWESVMTTVIQSEYEGSILLKSDTIVYQGQPGEFLTITGNGQLGWRTIERGYNPDGTVWYGTNFQTWNTAYTRTGMNLTIGEGPTQKSYTITTLSMEKLVLKNETIGYSGNRKYTQKSTFEFSN